MGLSLTKSPLERRNTLQRRSQRKSIIKTKSQTGEILKEIKKFKGTTEDDAIYIEIMTKIKNMKKLLDPKTHQLQPQVVSMNRDAVKKVDECEAFLEAKLKENQEKSIHDDIATTTKANSILGHGVDGEEDDEVQNNERKTVELNIIQIAPEDDEPISTVSPKTDKRASLIKIGVPVLPGAIRNALNRFSHQNCDEMLVEIRLKIQEIELKVSEFVGEMDGKHYNGLKKELEQQIERLESIRSNNEITKEQVKLCRNYVNNCKSFLDEKATPPKTDENHEAEEMYDDVFQITNNNTGGLKTTAI